jgi:N-methylhydantoinase B
VRSDAINPVTAEIIRGALETIAYEMATHVSLTATTPILNQSNERNATILDGTAALAALSVGIPQFMLSSTLPVRFALEFFGRDGLFPGDVLVANDPYHGGGHLPDYNVFAPVFHDGELMLIASIQCHHADTGGGMPDRSAL